MSHFPGLLSKLVWETIKDWLKQRNIPVQLFIVTVLALMFVGWLSAESSRRKLTIWTGSVGRRWRRILGRLLKGPQVVLEYDWDGLRELVPLRIRNNYRDVTYGIKVSSLYYGFRFIQFQEVHSVAGGSASELGVTVSIAGNQRPMDIELGRLFQQVSGEEPRSMAVFLKYMDTHSVVYETKCEIVYDGLKAKSFFRDWGRTGTIDRSDGIPPPMHLGGQ